MDTPTTELLTDKLCPRCHQPPSQVGRGDGCLDPYCPCKELNDSPLSLSSWRILLRRSGQALSLQDR